MLVEMRKLQDGELVLTELGKLLAAVGLEFLPDLFNVDDGAVSVGREQAQRDHPLLDNVRWQQYGVVYAAKMYASTHPVFQHPETDHIGAEHPVALADHEALHGVPKGPYVDASDPAGAAAERNALARGDAEGSGSEKYPSSRPDVIHPEDATSDVPATQEQGKGSGLPSAADLDQVADEELKGGKKPTVQ